VRIDDLGDDRQARLLPDVGEDAQTLFTEALEGVRRGARFEGATAQQRRSGSLCHQGGLEGLLLRLDRARAGDEGEGVRTDRNAPDVDRRHFGVVDAADQLVGRGDPHHVGNTGHRAEVQAAERLDVADQPDDGSGDTSAHEGLAADGLDPRNDCVDVVGLGVGLHHDDHGLSLTSDAWMRPLSRHSGWARRRRW
jgi:hypothetical protein